MDNEQLLKIRHSLSHILAAAVLEKDPKAKLAIGPAIDNGFYYDFELSGAFDLDEKNLKDIEKRMRALIGKKITFVKKEMPADAALKALEGQPYKQEMAKEFADAGEAISFYESGSFSDLCEGPHVKDTSEIAHDAFKIDRVAGAYWRGDEKNAMLTRIYGLAFNTKAELDAYLVQIEEAKKRDHRKLGKELDLFTFSELVGAGLPLWTPKGTVMRNALDDFVWELRGKYAYEKVTIPHLTKKDLYIKSGHWDKFADELFRIKTREGKEYALKPMNCPHHTQIYAHIPRSYKDLPQRYAETTMVYRDEQSGELGGLTRVLSITQDDSHVFCRHDQVKAEFFAIWDIIDTFYKAFDFTLKVRLSFHDPEHFEKYLGTKEIWKNAESALRDIAKARKADYFEVPGEAAMYGPKLDFMATDSIGRQHQVATIQLDMNMPERFELSCKNEKGEDERIVMIHAAIMGSIERFTAVLIEHLAGNFPLWLSPVQVRVLPIADSHKAYAATVLGSLKNAGIRAEMDDDGETLGKKIRRCKMDKLPYFLVIGDKEVENKTVTVESRDRGNEGAVSIDELVAKFKTEIAERRR